MLETMALYLYNFILRLGRLYGNGHGQAALPPYGES